MELFLPQFIPTALPLENDSSYSEPFKNSFIEAYEIEGPSLVVSIYKECKALSKHENWDAKKYCSHLNHGIGQQKVLEVESIRHSLLYHMTASSTN